MNIEEKSNVMHLMTNQKKPWLFTDAVDSVNDALKAAQKMLQDEGQQKPKADHRIKVARMIVDSFNTRLAISADVYTEEVLIDPDALM